MIWWHSSLIFFVVNVTYWRGVTALCLDEFPSADVTDENGRFAGNCSCTINGMQRLLQMGKKSGWTNCIPVPHHLWQQCGSTHTQTAQKRLSILKSWILWSLSKRSTFMLIEGKVNGSMVCTGLGCCITYSDRRHEEIWKIQTLQY